MMAEQLAKNFKRMVITAEWLKKFSNGRPKRLNGLSKISNGWSWTAERLMKIFERMVITAKRLKNISNGSPEWLNGSRKISTWWSCYGNNKIIYKLFQTDLLITGSEWNTPKIDVYYFCYANCLLNAHLNSEKDVNTASSLPCFVEELQRLFLNSSPDSHGCLPKPASPFVY